MITKGNDESCERNMVPHNRDDKFSGLTACEENQIVSLHVYTFLLIPDLRLRLDLVNRRLLALSSSNPFSSYDTWNTESIRNLSRTRHSAYMIRFSSMQCRTSSARMTPLRLLLLLEMSLSVGISYKMLVLCV